MRRPESARPGIDPNAAGQLSTGSTEALRPYRHLAVRVIDQALRDYANPGQPATERESAREFLAGSDMMYHWCEVAELDPGWMVACTRRLMGISAHVPAGGAHRRHIVQ